MGVVTTPLFMRVVDGPKPRLSVSLHKPEVVEEPQQSSIELIFSETRGENKTGNEFRYGI